MIFKELLPTVHEALGSAAVLDALDSRGLAPGQTALEVNRSPLSAATSMTEMNAYIRTGASDGANGKAASEQLPRKAELIRARPLAELGLPARAERALVRHGIQTVGVLITWSRYELSSEVIGLGAASLDLVEAALVRLGLGFAPETATTRRPMTSPLTNTRHIRNHNAWIAPD